MKEVKIQVAEYYPEKQSVDAEKSQMKSKDKDNDLVHQFLDLEQGFSQLPCRYLFKCFWNIFKESLSLWPQYCIGAVANTISYLFLNIGGQTDLLGIIGINNLLCILFYWALIFSGIDKLGIELSKEFGAKNYEGMKITFGMGCLTTAILFFGITVPIYWFCEPLLIMAGIMPSFAAALKWPTRLHLLVFGVQTCLELIQVLAMSQGIESYYGRLGVFNILISVPSSYLFVYHYRLGIYGVILVELSMEIPKLLLTFYVWSKLKPETKGFSSMSATLNHFISYFRESIKFAFSDYSSSFGIQISGFIVALAGDFKQTGAYYSIQNFGAYPESLGRSFAVVCRTRLNNLVGRGQYVAAKNLFRLVGVGLFFVCVIVGLLILSARNYIATWYTSSDPECFKWLVRQTIAYAILNAAHTGYDFSILGMKTLGNLNFLVKTTAILLVGGNLLIGYILKTQFNPNSVVFLSLNFSMSILVIVVVTIRAVKSDWIKIDRENSENSSKIAATSDMPRTTDVQASEMTHASKLATMDNKEGYY